MSLYNFVRRIANLGVGTRDLGFARPSTVPTNSIYGPRYNVRGTIGPVAPGYAKLGQQVVPVSILGDSGIGLQGQLALQTLAEQQGG